MIGYDLPVVEIDPEKVKPYFRKKMEDGMSREITTDFMNFVAQAFAQFEQVRDNIAKCDED